MRNDFLTAARSAADLVRDSRVAAAWTRPSALPEFSVGGLAAHLAFQVLALPDVLAAPVPAEPVVPVLGHYERVAWVDASLDDEINVRIREGGETTAAQGPAALVAQLDAVVEELAGVLPEVDNRPVRLAFWGDWSLLLDDLLVTRMMEIAVHSDDLAVSVDLPTPALPQEVLDPVLDLLVRLSARRHGPTTVLRALSRAERAPATITAF
jgi:hypothetical protein